MARISIIGAFIDLSIIVEVIVSGVLLWKIFELQAAEQAAKLEAEIQADHEAFEAQLQAQADHAALAHEANIFEVRACLQLG